MTLLAPQPPPSWNNTAEDILAYVFVALTKAETAFVAVIEPMTFYQNVSESNENRDASNNAESLARDFGVEKATRIDVFDSKASAKINLQKSGQWDKLTQEEQRLVDKMMLEDERAGLSLPVKKRELLISLKKELSQVCLEFKKNFNEENGKLLFTKEDLKGIEDNVLSNYPKHTEGGVEFFEVSFKYPDIDSVVGHAENPESRRRAQEGRDSRLVANVPVLARALDIRRQIAKLLGYDSWADYMTKDRMIKSGKAVQDFLDDVEKKMLPIGIKDREALLAVKKKDCELNNLPSDGKFYIWDYGYYSSKYIEQKLDIDNKVIEEHFPVPVVVPAVLGIYQNLFGVRFEELKNASTWHPDVQAYSVWRKDATDEAGFIGYTYLDLYPRPGKHSHISMWPLIPSYDLPNGKRNYPVNVMLADLTKPTPERPGLMRHHDVVMFFHEMGHVFHDLLSKTKLGRFHGTTGALDFVEAPSQMMENWCWEPKILEKISSHYLTGNPLSPQLARSLVKNRDMLVGLSQLQQIFYAKFDLKVHLDQNHEDYSTIWCEMRQKTSLMDYITTTPGHAAFQHIAGEYSVGYYGYLYSRVFAADMYVTVFKDDPLDPIRGNSTKTRSFPQVQAKMSSISWRKPNNEAFFQQLLEGQELQG